MRIAFYAPLKPPDHPTPSGDREMARLLLRALAAAGYDVRVASRLRSYCAEPSDLARCRLERRAAGEVKSLLAVWNAAGGVGWRPDLWFTYHPYYKAPDWIGPGVCEAFGIPYVTAEASYAPKRDIGPWREWQATVAAAVTAAAVNFCLTPVDREGLNGLPGQRGLLVDLPPFIDRPLQAPKRPRRKAGRVELITVAMMRPGDKLESYRMLARTLAGLLDLSWRLTIVGDGPARSAVAGAFSRLPPERLIWTGALSPEQVALRLAEGDLYVWPGFGEAYGMSYLEAQAEGLPVVGQRTGGIPAVVVDGVTGLLTGLGDEGAFAGAVRRLVLEADLRRRMGAAAQRFVRSERTLASATRILQGALEPLRFATEGTR
ncbi:MAG TPA: glycosyltransferase family 4 protein [Hyphomicrobiaceae bacterium]|nr:glycosyltransferase family 4 protein [Hyphomicrobiaceae bacterium]